MAHQATVGPMRARAIEETRKSFDARGRRAWEQHRIRRPLWCRPDDPLHAVYAPGGQQRLFREGAVVWGVLVQANNLLFERGSESHPAMLLYGLDRSLDDALPDLEAIAHELFALKGTTPRERDAAEFARLVSDEASRKLSIPAPASLTRGHTLSTTTTMIHREALPHGCIAGRALPLLVLEGPGGMSLVVPREHWSDRHLFEWGALPAQASDVV